MKRFLPLILIALVLGGAAALTLYRAPESVALPRDVYLSQLEQSHEAVLIDLRTPEEYASGHLAGALNIDFYNATFESQIRALDPSKAYYIYCRSGNRSKQAAETMRAAGITALHDLQGGIAGNPDLSLVRGAEAGVRTIRTDDAVDPTDILSAASLPPQAFDTAITDAERAGLIFMYEEEKLARDVYTTLGATWGIRVFANITESEKTHMAAVQGLLQRYGIENPATDDSVGAFYDPKLATLYEELTARGNQSEIEALTVGALIEDLDIADLDRYMKETTQSDIIAVYAELQRGSRNHLRAFTRQLNARGASYEPQYISRDTYDAIIESAQEKGKGWW